MTRSEMMKNKWKDPKYRSKMTGWKHSAESIKKMIEIHTGTVSPPENRKALSDIVKKLWQDSEYRKNHLGCRHTEESRRIIREAKMGWKPSEETKKKMGEANIGRKPSEETCRKLRDACKDRFGEKNHNWRGGTNPIIERIRGLSEYKRWRLTIFSRDNFTCRHCGARGGYLEAHHSTKNFKDIIWKYKINTIEEAISCSELWDINNGQTLCKECHGSTKKRNFRLKVLGKVS